MIEKTKQLKFEHQLAVDITSGIKTATFRFFDDKNIRVGDVLEVIDKVALDNPASWMRVGTISIHEVSEKRVCDLTTDDWRGHEVYANESAFLETMRRCYTQPILPETPVKNIRFSFTSFDKPQPFFTEGLGTQLPDEIKLYADGGSRGNPGPSAGGFVILDMADRVLRESNKYLGITTNNQAEYHALKGGLEMCCKEQAKVVHVYMDSLLVVNQMKGIFKVKNRELWAINEAAKKILPAFKSITFTHVPRELNKLADAEVNKALDAVRDANR